MNYLWMIGLAPFSWRLGLVKKTDRKSVYALGPFRYAWHDIGERT